MSTSGTRRSVGVRRYKTSNWCTSGHNNLFSAWVPGAIPPTDKKWTHDCHVITGYTGSAKSLKRLAEIAAMDEDVLARTVALALRDGIYVAAGVQMPEEPQALHGNSLTAARHIIQALGLSPKNSKKAGRKL